MKRFSNMTRNAAAAAARAWRNATAARWSMTLTWEGLAAIALTICVGLAAINTGANLLYFVFGVLAAFLTVSAVASTTNLQHVRVERAAPREVAAGEEVRIGLRAQNLKRLYHSYALRLTDLLPDSKPLGHGFVLRLACGQTARVEYRTTFDRRGLKRLARLGLSSRFPFGFTHKTLTFPATGEILVLPRLYPAVEYLERHEVDLGVHDSGRRGHGASLHSLRDYAREDSARSIHWKASAKAGRLIARETESEERRQISLVLDNACEPAAAVFLSDAFERAVSCAASVARDLLREGFQVEVLTRSGRIPFDTGTGHLRRILRAMALIEILPLNGLPPPSLPDGDSVALWFDYGAATPPRPAGPRFKVLSAHEWPAAAPTQLPAKGAPK